MDCENKFQIGEHKTRDGKRAIVRFVMQEPNASEYSLVGEIQDCVGRWTFATWTKDGAFDVDGDDWGTCEYDLVAPKEYAYAKCRQTEISPWYSCLDALASVMSLQDKDLVCMAMWNREKAAVDWGTIEVCTFKDAKEKRGAK